MMIFLKAVFAFPDACWIDKFIPKKVVIENNTLSSKEKRILKEAVERITLLAIFKPETSRLPAVSDDTVDYSEVLFVHVALRNNLGTSLASCLQRCFPYPLVVVFTTDTEISVQTAEKHRHGVSADKRICVTSWLSPWVPMNAPEGSWDKAFLQLLRFNTLDTTHLMALYQCVERRIIAGCIASYTQVFQEVSSQDASAAITWLANMKQLQKERQALQRQLKRETSLPRRVQHLEALHRIKHQYDALLTEYTKKEPQA